MLAIVAEQTGYPPSCSTWTSTWRPTSASTRSSRPRCSPPIRERYGIERDDTLKLRDYPTLHHVVGFVRSGHAAARRRWPSRPAAPAPAAALAEPAPAPVPVAAAPALDAVEVSAVLAIVAEQTGYPPDMLDLDLDLEADLGIDTVKQAEMFAADPRGATGSRATTT